MPSETLSYRARWIFPVDAEPIAGGSVQIETGQITAVHAGRDPRAVDLGNTAIIPGLINAHTHLEFSDLAEPIRPPRPFADWIRAVVARRRNRSVNPAETISRGLRECRQNGTTLLGETATDAWPADAIPDDSPRVVVFRELLGLPADQTPGQLAIAREHLQAGDDPLEDDGADPIAVRGISPHAPYSVHPDLFHALVDLAAEFHAPLAIHLAETKVELELLEHGTGELARMLDELGVWQNDAIPRETRPLDYLRPLAKLDRVLIIHGNYLSPDEIEFLAQHSNLAVVYCPRTHAYFGHSEHPWQELLGRGVTIALGTDSRASNPDLSLWQELLFLRARHLEVDPGVLLSLGTINGARALGFDQQTGSLTPGKSADLAVVSLRAEENSDPFSLLFAAGNRITATMKAGRWISLSDEHAHGPVS